MEIVANWKSLNSNLMRQERASLGHVIIYSMPKSRGYRAGKNGEVRIPLPVPFKPFVGAPDVISVPFRCSLFPAKTSIPEYFVDRDEVVDKNITQTALCDKHVHRSTASENIHVRIP